MYLSLRPPCGLIFVGAICLLPLAACTTVGPDYAGPPALHTGTQLLRDRAAASPQALLPAHWWLALNDAELNHLAVLALQNSPDLGMARARLKQARAMLSQQQDNALPKSTASAIGLSLDSAPGTAAASSTRFYSLGLDASWEVDLFGGTRRAVEAASAQAGQAQAQLADAQVSLLAELVETYAQLRERQHVHALRVELARLDADQLALIGQRKQAGVVGVTEFDNQQAASLLSRQAAQDAQRDLENSQDLLALLCGLAPGELDRELQAVAPIPGLPQQIGVGDVAALMKNRPDIRAAERALAASSAGIGQQEAGYFPKLTLLGDLGLGASSASQLLKRSSTMLLGVPYISWDWLDLGRTRAAVDKARAEEEESRENYRAVVLKALRDANQSLSHYGQQRDLLLSREGRLAAMQRNFEMSAQRRKAGVADQSEWIEARRNLLAARIDQLQAQSGLLQAFAGLQ